MCSRKTDRKVSLTYCPYQKQNRTTRNVAPEQVAFPDDVLDVLMCPVEDRNAVVVDEMQAPVELMAQLGDEHLWHANDGVERWIEKLENFLEDFVVACQSVLQLHLTTTNMQRLV